MKPELIYCRNIRSKREIVILKLLGKGYSSKEGADELFISMHTVETHRRNMLDKIIILGLLKEIKAIQPTANYTNLPELNAYLL